VPSPRIHWNFACHVCWQVMAAPASFSSKIAT
jgi:hypothetical protein